MPTPNLYATAGREPFVQVAPALRSIRVDLLYVTDRAPELDEQGNPGYGHKRSYSMAFGSAVVEIGEGTGCEQLERDSRRRARDAPLNLRLAKVTELGRFPETPFPFAIADGKLIVDQRSVAAQDRVEQQLREQLERRLALTPKKEVLIFVHATFRALPAKFL